VPRDLKIAAGILATAVLIGLISLRSLHERVQRISAERSEELARREVLAPPISTPTDVKVEAKIFWAAGNDTVAPAIVELPLSADAAQRSKQVLDELIADPPSAEQRILPADTTLLGFYVLPDGTAIADFSDALVTETPSGISSEEAVIQSITETLENNVASLRRLKILIHGQEVDTLAGHVDLTGFFDLNPPAAAQPSAAPAQGGATGAPSSPAPVSATPQKPQARNGPGVLTGADGVGKLSVRNWLHPRTKGALLAS